MTGDAALITGLMHGTKHVSRGGGKGRGEEKGLHEIGKRDR